MSVVRLYGDGASPDPTDYVHALSRLQRTGQLAPDRYARGGSVERLEKAMARALGKEQALYCPTGTLANLLALRALCPDRPRVLVQADSHLANDAGDGAGVLLGLALIPLAADGVCFTEDDLAAEIARAASARVKSPIGAVSIESPLRRRFNRAVPLDQLREISRMCRRAGIGLHLDGARLFVATAAQGVHPRRYADLFDTVYVSLYKHFGAPGGAILAGPRALLEDLHHARRMFGGSPAEAYLDAALALRGLENNRLPQALERGRRLVRRLAGRFTAFADGTNIVVLGASRPAAARLARRLKKDDILIGPYQKEIGGISVTFNETILNRSEASLVRDFQKALA